MSIEDTAQMSNVFKNTLLCPSIGEGDTTEVAQFGYVIPNLWLYAPYVDLSKPKYSILKYLQCMSTPCNELRVETRSTFGALIGGSIKTQYFKLASIRCESCAWCHEFQASACFSLFIGEAKQRVSRSVGLE